MRIEIIESKNIDVTLIVPNDGQISGVPKNPRYIKDERYRKLKKSIKDNPEMLGARELLVFPLGDVFVIIGGNMRYRAAVDLGYKELPCKILPPETSPEQLRAITIKDNVPYGDHDWDLLANEWDTIELESWGLEIPDIKETEKLSELSFEDIYYMPENIPSLELIDCVDLDKFNQKIKVIEESDLPAEQKEILKIFTYRFIKIDFESVANYYFFNASEQEKAIIERLRLVLCDSGIDGFIEDDLLRIHKLIENWND
jgi:hypothetical protein